MKMKVISAQVVEDAMKATEDLLVSLHKILVARVVDQDPLESFYIYFAERVENGETIEKVLEEVDRGILITLIKRGYNSSQELAKIIKKSGDATRRLLSSRNISLKEIRR